MFNYKFEKCSRPLSEVDMSDIESLIGQPLPVDVKELYLLYNGGIIEGGRCTYITASQSEYGINSFLPIKYKRYKDDLVMEDSYVFNAKLKSFIPPDYLPIAYDDGGFVFCYKLGSGKIYFCSLDHYECNSFNHLEVVADSLADFVNLMLTDDEAGI